MAGEAPPEDAAAANKLTAAAAGGGANADGNAGMVNVDSDDEGDEDFAASLDGADDERGHAFHFVNQICTHLLFRWPCPVDACM